MNFKNIAGSTINVDHITMIEAKFQGNTTNFGVPFIMYNINIYMTNGGHIISKGHELEFDNSKSSSEFFRNKKADLENDFIQKNIIGER